MAIRDWHAGKLVIVWVIAGALWLVLRAAIPDYNVVTDMLDTYDHIEFSTKKTDLKPKLDSLRSLVDSLTSLQKPNRLERALARRAANEHDSIVIALREEKRNLENRHPGYTDREVTIAWLLIAVLPAAFVTWRWLSGRENESTK